MKLYDGRGMYYVTKSIFPLLFVLQATKAGHGGLGMRLVWSNTPKSGHNRRRCYKAAAHKTAAYSTNTGAIRIPVRASLVSRDQAQTNEPVVTLKNWSYTHNITNTRDQDSRDPAACEGDGHRVRSRHAHHFVL